MSGSSVAFLGGGSSFPYSMLGVDQSMTSDNYLLGVFDNKQMCLFQLKNNFKIHLSNIMDLVSI